MRWTLVLVACACLGLFLATGRAEAQQPPGAPTIGSVTAGTNTLTISWTASPDGGAAITAYDLQYIRTDDDETDPANWTLLDNVWTTTGGGTLQHVVGDLLDGLSYDLQVRARNSEGSGDWSDTHAASTNDHDFATSRSSLVALGSSLPGYIASGAGADADDDTFRISVPPGGGYLWVYTTGEIDTNGVLADWDRNIIGNNEDGWLPRGVRNFSIRHSVGEGTYYFRVQGQRGSTGAYRVHARLVTLPGATAATAQTVTLGEPALGRIQLVRGLSEDNYFTFTLTATTDVAIMASGFVDVIGELRDSGQTVLGSENGSGFLGADGFLLRRSLPADTYYVRVRARVYNGAGPYVLLIDEAGDAGGSSSVAATPLAFGNPLVARISSDTEEDYYRFTLDAETYVRFLAQPLGDSFALEATLYDDQNTDLSAYTVDRADYARHGEPYAAGILEKLEAGTYTLRIKAPSGETGGPYLVFAQVDTDQAAIIAGCKATTDAQTNALTDPLSGCQWPVKNTNQYGGDGDDINIESVWAAGKLGAGVNIAIVDNGIHAGHEDLVDNIVAARNHDYYGFGPDALATHGTQVAGLIAARDNDIGIRGVAPRASIYVYNLTADEDKIADNEADAMTRHMADTAVSNNSWSFPDDGDLHSPTAAWEEAVERGVTEGFGGKGVFYVWAAGNGGSEDNSNLDGRANFYAVTAACATSWRNRITDHSERGSNLWVCAPAGYRSELFRVSPLITTTTTGHRYTRNQGGASAATAIVSGVAALVRAENPDLTWRDVKLILAASASRNSPVHGKWEGGARKYRSTSQRYWYSHNYGFGTVDAAAAVGLAAGWTTNVPPLRTVEAASGPVDTPLEDAILEDIRPGSTVSSTITLPDGYVEFIEYIEVEVTMAHSSVRDLRIVLESPSGAVSVLSTAVIQDQSHVFDGSFRFGSARHLGEDPGGTWTLRVTDRIPGHLGTFASWKIKAYGHGLGPGYLPAPTATSGMRTLTIGWDAPTDIGDSAVTSYDLRYIPSNATAKEDPANWMEVTGIGTDDTGTYEIVGLSPGVQYDLKVRAANDTGPGPWSESLVVRISLEQPFAPSLTSVTPRDQGLEATWDAPTEDGGSEITSYDLRTIRSNSTDVQKEDPTQWDETFSAWTPLDGDLQGRVAGLTNGVAYDVQVRAENAIGEGDWSETLKGTPAIQNTDASFADDTADREVAENLRVGVDVGAPVSATDPDGDPLTYSILGGHDLFEIDAMNGQLRTKVELDADEGVTSHTLTVDVSDMLNSSDDEDPAIDDSIEVTVTVTNVNEQPVVMGTRTIDHAENAGTALANASYSATDPEGANIIWSVGGIDKDFFAISSGGVLSFADDPDFEARPRDNTYEVTVQATEEDDVDALTGTLAVTVTVTDEDEDEELKFSAPRPLIGLDFTAAFKEGMGDAVQSPTWVWARSMSRSGAGTDITGATAATYRPVGADRDNYLRVTASYNDGHSAKTLQATSELPTLPDSSTNRPPVFPSPLFAGGATGLSVDENATAGTVVGVAPQATDPELGTLSYSLAVTGFTTDPPFEINATSREIRVASDDVLDHEDQDSYSVTVTAKDEYTATKTATFDITVEDVNERPVVRRSSGTGPFSIVENSGTDVGRFVATDPEGGGVTWSLATSGDHGRFEIDEVNGALSLKETADYESSDLGSDKAYTVTVQATEVDDGDPLTGSLDVTVTITNVNERPVIDGEAAHTIEENSLERVGRYTKADPEGRATSWLSLMGADALLFTIDEYGELTFAEPPDYESSDIGRDKAYNVIVRASDDDNLIGELAVTVTVTPVDERPVVDGPRSVMDYPENSPTTTVVGRYMATDPEGAGVTWSDLSGNDAADFDLSNNGVLTFKVSPDYEMKHEYEVTLNAFDGRFTGSLTVTVTIADVNEPPTISGPVVVDFTENGTGTVEMYSATDPDVGATQAWSLAGADGSDFAITNGVLTFINPPDYDMPTDDSRPYNEYLVTVQVNDGANTVTRPVTVRVLDVNEAPTVSGKLTPSVEENSTAVATYTATDPERATITWSVEDPGAGDFTITNAGALSFASAPNYEVKSSYTVTVRASDGTNTDDHDVTVAVTDVDEREVLVLSHRTPLIGEEFTAAFEGTGDNVDSVQPPTWAWARSAMGSSSGWMPIIDATNATYEPTGDDRQRYLRVTASYNDGHSNDGHSAKTLSATSEFATAATRASNTPPMFPDPLFTGVQMGLSVRENAGVRTVVGVAPQATDMQGGALRYSLAVSGFTSDPPFGIDASSRQIRVVRAVLDHEDQDSYSVTVTVVDEFDATATATFDITIEDVNEPPMAVADPSVTTEEDMPVTFDVLGNDTDPDEGDTLTVMTITTQPDRGRVVADPGTQMLTYTPAKDDHDTYTFMYTARDDDPVRRLTSPPARVTVTINAVNDAPEFATEVTTRTVSEGARPGDTVGTKVEATDVDDITLTYSLAGASDFVIDASGPTAGQIRVAPDVTLDRELTSSYEVTVTATDRLNESDSITVTINVSDVPEPPTAVNDTATTAEDQSVKIDVLANDTDPDTERAALRVSVLARPLNGRARVEADRTITYTPNANFAGENSFTYRLSDGSLSDDGSVTVTVTPVNDAPTFPSTPAARSVPESAKAGANVGVPVTATDVENAMLTYRLVPGADSGSFNIDADSGQITVATGVTFDIATQATYVVMVTADDGSGEANATATVEVTITVTAGPPIIITGGGGGGGPSGPSPSEVDFEWTVKRDIEELDGGNDWPTGLWSDGETLWIAENGQGADDEVYAYDRASGERLTEREFELAETNRAPRGFWSDGETVWVSDSGRERLFAYRLADGERLDEREFALAAGNSDARGIWSDHETMWVLDGRADALFAYALASGELLAEYALDSANSDPHGIWSDGVTVWVSDHGAKRLFAYRLPAPGGPAAEDTEPQDLERVRDEEFGELSKASNNSPRGIWSDGDFMYVADESDDRVYTYNMPDGIDARLASLTLSGVDIGEFDPARTDYEGTAGEGVTETTVEAEAMQRRTDVAIDPPDADGNEANGYQVALAGLAEITVTVTSADGSRKKVYRVALEAGWDPARDPWPHCLRGAVSEGFSLVVYEGGSVEELVSCAESRHIVAFYALHDGAYVSYILGAPGFVNAGFLELFADGLPPITPLIAGSNGPPSPDPFGDDLDDGGRHAWPECLRGDIAAGFSLVVYEGGSVEELEACAQSRDVTALYTLSEGEFVSYILGAPDFVNRPFRDLFAGGLPSVTPLVARSEGQPGGR